MPLLVTIIFFMSANVVYAESTHRISGETRYHTASNIAKEGWPDGSDYAILAYGGNFPDALASTPLASKYNAPILLTDKLSLTPVTKSTLISLGTKNVIIIGGTGAVSGTVESQLKSMGLTVSRISGSDRYNTSIEIAKRVGSDSGKLIIAPGSDFSNALSVSSYAGENQIPIILVNQNTVSTNLKQFVSGLTLSQTYIIGTTNEISEAVKNSFPNTTRIQGSDKYGTNLAVLKAFDSDYNFSTAFLATGTSFADALAGSSYAAKLGAPIILTGKTMDSRIISYIDGKTSAMEQLTILGGEAAISTSLVNNYLGAVATLTAKEIFTLVSPSVVYIETFDSSGNALAYGSGFIVDAAKGKVATNYHIIDGAYSARVKTLSGTVYTVEKVFAYNVANDVALLKINGSGLKAVTLGDSSTIETGDKIYAIGNPQGLENTISDGLISTKSRVLDGTTYIQISAPISRGSSGGVLLNEQGNVIGITSAVIDNGQNLNFAVPINSLKPLLSLDINKTLNEMFGSTNVPSNPGDDVTYLDVWRYIQTTYGTNIIDGKTIKYNVTVSPYEGDLDGSHAGSIFIVFTATTDTSDAEDEVIMNSPSAYMSWFISMIADIDTRYGMYEYNGGMWYYDHFFLLFCNWSGDLEFWVPSE